MTKKWCNGLPPSVRVLGANRMTEVRCKNSITKHEEGSQREKCEVDECAEELDPEETRLTGATSLFL